ncbi:hypothetical protein T265_12189 [Opisthorchis viverrini]|uniref:Uncharacterized protein n=1 Tax=Opisthorchis viverrini TaxID=6198 RepID=A0A074YZR2_OPIVI|nr:hypothetical protein T265_12189 [Opisthorchis viverrini]KER18692.1 hypothetical protein T265_12189 [Opisthorchis viverrini]
MSSLYELTYAIWFRFCARCFTVDCTDSPAFGSCLLPFGGAQQPTAFLLARFGFARWYVRFTNLCTYGILRLWSENMVLISQATERKHNREPDA